jgi:hypothetical protein
MNNANRSYQMMSWNVRGFNNPSRQEEVKQVVSTFKLDVIGVLIILLDKKRLNRLSALLNLMSFACKKQNFQRSATLMSETY